MQAAEELQFLSTKLVNSSTNPFYVLYIVKNFQGLDLFPPPPIMDGNKTRVRVHLDWKKRPDSQRP